MSSVEPPAVELGALAHFDHMVTSDADGGAGSLRQIITEAAPDDVIAFHPDVTLITLTSGQLVLDKNLTITGPEGGTITISGNDTSRVFFVAAGTTVTLRNLTITGGWAPVGGGIDNWGNLTIENSTIAGNHATQLAGGIHNAGTLTIENSTISGNQAVALYGGGIVNWRTLTVTNSTLSGNSTPGISGGGAIFNHAAGYQATVTNSTFSGNTAIVGGGIYNYAGALTIENSTFTGNAASSHGGGVRNNGNLTIKSSTIAGNTALLSAGGIYGWSSGTLTLENSIVASNTAAAGPDIHGTVTNASHNLIGDTTDSSGITHEVNGNIVDPNPGLELDPDGKPKLADNGGLTQTIALTAGSRAIDAASGTSSPTTDQRGVPRPQGAGHDIGAYEYDYPVFTGFSLPVSNPPTLNTAKAGQTIPLKWHLQDVFGNPITDHQNATISVTSLACTAGTTTDAIEEYARGTSGLQNLGDGHYQFNWATPKNYASSCKTMRLDLGDGVTQTALFQFTK